jgi:DNA-binding Xre family transcriptional regulator
MGRLKLSDEKKAKNISISLLPKHKKILDDLCRKLNFGASDLIQRVLEKEWKDYKESK